jgi:hypothetical protein
VQSGQRTKFVHFNGDSSRAGFCFYFVRRCKQAASRPCRCSWMRLDGP